LRVYCHDTHLHMFFNHQELQAYSVHLEIRCHFPLSLSPLSIHRFAQRHPAGFLPRRDHNRRLCINHSSCPSIRPRQVLRPEIASWGYALPCNPQSHLGGALTLASSKRSKLRPPMRPVWLRHGVCLGLASPHKQSLTLWDGILPIKGRDNT